jgi:hypothetical protein
MFDRFRVAMTVFRITNQPISEHYLQGKEQRGPFAKDMADLMMRLYDVRARDGTLRRDFSVRRTAASLATQAIIDLEHELSDTRDGHIAMRIEILRACLREFGKIYKEEAFVADCLATHDLLRREVNSGIDVDWSRCRVQVPPW